MKNLMKFRFAGIQLLVGADKEANLRRASAKIAEAVANGAQVVSLPECFNSPYSTASFGPYSEVVGEGPTTAMLRSAAAEHRIVLIGGSFPEKEVVNGQEKYYNTSLIFDEEGTIIGKHRKIHLFDIDIPGGITFRESDTLSRGNTPTIVNTKYGKLGIGICYDLRFPELAAYYAQQGPLSADRKAVKCCATLLPSTQPPVPSTGSSYSGPGRANPATNTNQSGRQPSVAGGGLAGAQSGLHLSSVGPQQRD